MSFYRFLTIFNKIKTDYDINIAQMQNN